MRRTLSSWIILSDKWSQRAQYNIVKLWPLTSKKRKRPKLTTLLWCQRLQCFQASQKNNIFWRRPIDFPLVYKLYYLHAAWRQKMLSRGQLGNFGVSQKMVQALRFVHNRMMFPRKVKQTGGIHVWQWYNILSCLLYYNWWGFRDRKGIIIHLFSEISSGPVILIH